MNLKKCPFCGGDAEIWHEMHPPFGEYVYCKKCGCRTLKHIDAQNAIIEWNRRFDPSNDPLTTEELRKMDGEPVWVVGVSSINRFEGHWDICDWWDKNTVMFPYSGEQPKVDDYGITWAAYRRRPEEVAT